MPSERVWVPHRCGHSAPCDVPKLWKLPKEPDAAAQRRLETAQERRKKLLAQAANVACPACLPPHERYPWQLGSSIYLRPVRGESDPRLRKTANRLRRRIFREIPRHLEEWRKAVEWNPKGRLCEQFRLTLRKLQALEQMTDLDWWFLCRRKPLAEVLQMLGEPELVTAPSAAEAAQSIPIAA